jgi:translation initiation factor IF-2
MLVVVESESVARELVSNRKRIQREHGATAYQTNLISSVKNMLGPIAGGDDGSGELSTQGGITGHQKQMYVVVKADVQGSAEALKRAFSELILSDGEGSVRVNVLISDVGDVTKTDVTIASVSPDTSIIAFNVASNMAAMDEARRTGVSIEYHSIIYDANESISCRMQEVLSPTPEGSLLGKAVMQVVYDIGKTGKIAGSKCVAGRIKKGSNVRIMRGDKILGMSKVKSLRASKTEVEEIAQGVECGIGLADFEDFEGGDIIECYTVDQ